MHSYFSYLTYNSLSPFYVFSVICKLSFVAHSMLFLLLRLGGIEKKPRPKKAFLVKFWHWNLNGLAAHDFVKILRILKKLCEKTTHNSDIICLFETFWIPQYSKMIKKIISMTIHCWECIIQVTTNVVVGAYIIKIVCLW